ncbi:hypothetical protein [Novipirellula aureliae]|uniref:hypothetical protein n=1 Tax=Novipirellula aureliae TaxID=2527966 RepID=UPI0011B4DFBA|nr:hypothetical protein [Novipirellula aureliae]
MTQIHCDTTARRTMHQGYKVKFLKAATGTRDDENSAGPVKAAELQRAILFASTCSLSTYSLRKCLSAR